MEIRIFITGGTIDDLDYTSETNAPKNHVSVILALLKQCRVSIDCDVEVLMQKDSRLINEEDRKFVYKKCLECSEKKIVITHGTATMPLTAKFLGKKKLRKTIVLFGSAIPANKPNSDALFNLGAAVTAAQILPFGVYVTMNGKIFKWNNVKKNLATGKFEKEK